MKKSEERKFTLEEIKKVFEFIKAEFAIASMQANLEDNKTPNHVKENVNYITLKTVDSVIEQFLNLISEKDNDIVVEKTVIKKEENEELYNLLKKIIEE